MANWKKLLVSGSYVSQLANDAGYLTSATAFDAFKTASVNGINIVADSTTDTLSIVTGSAGAGLTITGNSGNDTITFDLSSIPNSSLANSTMAVGGVTLTLGATDATPAFNLSDATNYSYANLTNVPALISGSGQVDGSSISNNSVNFGGVTVALGGSDTTPAFDLQHATGYPFASLASTPNGIVSASAFSKPSQGTLRATLNGVNEDTGLGLTTGDSPTFTNLTLSGDLTVNGATTTIDTTNLTVADKFILLNSGSATNTDESGIIFGGADGVRGSGTALIWNGDYNGNDGRLAIANTVAHDATTATPNYHIAGVFEGNEADAATAQADHKGNIRVDGSDDIWIYV